MSVEKIKTKNVWLLTLKMIQFNKKYIKLIITSFVKQQKKSVLKFYQRPCIRKTPFRHTKIINVVIT